ncbi:MAG: hypothetical protein LKI93_02390 [Bifidobacteriaceae bacterium]|nr:hypothetical protein [Bifidobacteriaceae bacterium]MCI1914265.1 hypothetical protein [Bifidobacteriaceae bacterium]
MTTTKIHTAQAAAQVRLRERIDNFRIDRAAKGMEKADFEFFGPLVEEWVIRTRKLKEGEFTAKSRLHRDEFIERLAVALHESMGLRDALILSIVSALPTEELIEVAVHPTRPSTAHLVSSTLSSVFRDASKVPQQAWCTSCLDLLIEVHSKVPRDYCVQPLAVMAYLLWWSGRPDEASGAALRSLSIDGECTLASIVLSAVEYGIVPAWKERREKNAITGNNRPR